MTHILIANQHGENRGDEAAMRAMLDSFTKAIPEVSFTLLYQFRDRDLRLQFKEPVEAYPIVLPAMTYLRGAIYTLFKMVGLDFRALLPTSLRRIIDAYEKADLVVSAPGGPYFGDIYADHEIIHWWYVLLGNLFMKPVFLYATSAGPFKKGWLNPIRRWLYRKFDLLVTREEISAGYIKSLLNDSVEIEVTADSAIQASFSAYPREEYFKGERSDLAEKMLVAVSLNDYKYPDSPDPGAKKTSYNDAMIEILAKFAQQTDCHYLFLPQLYGAVHDDASYLREMGNRLPDTVSWEVVDSDLDSDTQRQLFAMCDLHIASRYHPAIFGHTAFVPGVCIYYEHKALGFMRQLGLEENAFEIRKIQAEPVLAALSNIMANREQIIEQLHQMVPELQQRSARTTKMAIELLNSSGS